MPAPTRTLTTQSARDLIRERSFTKGTGRRVGVELEWFTTPSDDPPDHVELTRILGPLLPLPSRSSLTFEPGGQVELSSVPFDGVGAACAAIEGDSSIVRRALRQTGYPTFAGGFDPDRTHRLRTDAPRYVAMRSYLDRYGAAGARMMCGSAAIHVNVDAGDDDEGRRRWHIAHLIGPTLVAAFANSPFTEVGASGYKSSRVAAWHDLDPTRTRPVENGGYPSADWVDYALDARVMFIRRDTRYEMIDDGMTLTDWITDGHPLGHPDQGDVAYHLTTLFPPVRPRGYLELRMIDMLPDPWWRAALALTTAFVCDRSIRDVVERACAGTEDRWHLAAKCGLEDPPLFEAANMCFGAALGVLDRWGCDRKTIAVSHAYVERFVRQGLTPADEQLMGLGRLSRRGA